MNYIYLYIYLSISILMTQTLDHSLSWLHSFYIMLLFFLATCPNSPTCSVAALFSDLLSVNKNNVGPAITAPQLMAVELHRRNSFQNIYLLNDTLSLSIHLSATFCCHLSSYFKLMMSPCIFKCLVFLQQFGYENAKHFFFPLNPVSRSVCWSQWQ